MINESTKDILKTMHCTSMAEEFEKQLEEPGTYGKLGFEERFGLIVDAEWNRRQSNKLAKHIRNARFAVSKHLGAPEAGYYRSNILSGMKTPYYDNLAYQMYMALYYDGGDPL